MAARVVAVTLSLLALLEQPIAVQARNVLGRAHRGSRSTNLREMAAAMGASPSTLDLPAETLAQYISTGHLPISAIQTAEQGPPKQTPSYTEGASAFSGENATADSEIIDAQIDPYEKQSAAIMSNLSNYSQQLKLAGIAAQEKLKEVQEQEQMLANKFEPTQKALGAMIKSAAKEASKAEASTLLERLTKIHYEQVGLMDRSSRFWEEQIAREKELTRVAEAKARLEDTARNAIPLEQHAKAVEEQDLLDAEKARIQEWLQGFNSQLKAQETAIVDQVAENGGGVVQQVHEVGKVKEQVYADVQIAATPASQKPWPTV